MCVFPGSINKSEEFGVFEQNKKVEGDPIGFMQPFDST